MGKDVSLFGKGDYYTDSPRVMTVMESALKLKDLNQHPE